MTKMKTEKLKQNTMKLKNEINRNKILIFIRYQMKLIVVLFKKNIHKTYTLMLVADIKISFF